MDTAGGESPFLVVSYYDESSCGHPAPLDLKSLRWRDGGGPLSFWRSS